MSQLIGVAEMLQEAYKILNNPLDIQDIDKAVKTWLENYNEWIDPKGKI